MKLSFDELHEPKTKIIERSLPYEQYFGEMDLTPEQKEKRIEMANRFEDMMLFFFALVGVMNEYSYVNDQFVIAQIEAMYIAVLSGSNVLFNDTDTSKNNQIAVDNRLRNYANQFAQQIVQTTHENSDNAWYTSTDRAKFVAENEANTSYNYDENSEAIRNGNKFKTWISMKDRRVRKTHARVDSEKIPINEPFLVGNSEMMFPKDETLGASASEIVNCRCTVKYSKN